MSAITADLASLTANVKPFLTGQSILCIPLIQSHLDTGKGDGQSQDLLKIFVQPGGVVLYFSRHYLSLNPSAKQDFGIRSNSLFDNVQPTWVVPSAKNPEILFSVIFGSGWSSRKGQMR